MGVYDSSRYGKQYGLIDDLTLEYDGNNRMDVGENGSVWQICHYYPFGMLMGRLFRGLYAL